MLQAHCSLSMLTYIALFYTEIDPTTGSTYLVKRTNLAFCYTHALFGVNDNRGSGKLPTSIYPYLPYHIVVFVCKS